MRWLLVILASLAMIASPAFAHEIRPAYLEIREAVPGDFDVRFRQPVIDAGEGMIGGLNLAPVFPQACAQSESIPVASADNYLTQRYKVTCPTELPELIVTIQALERTLTDVYVTHLRADDTRSNHLLNARTPSLTLGDPGRPAVLGYFMVGLHHLLGGLDHVLFVIGLILLVPSLFRLITVATTFTLAHSLTLGLSVLDIVRLPSAPVEAGIALSVLYLAYELTRPDGATGSAARRRPELIAFGFGLLHGFGFAGALAETGMPAGQIAPALLMFNIGVEAGQLLVIAVIGIVLAALRQFGAGWERRSRQALTSALAIGAAYFFAGAFSNLVVT